MKTTSRTVRPTAPRPMVLTPRDRAVLKEVARFRYLTAAHVAALVFTNASLRVAQERLRRLWEHGYLDRNYLRAVGDGTSASLRGLTTPLYTLARKGANVLSNDYKGEPGELATTPRQNARGFETLRHHLVALAFLAAATAASRADSRHEVVPQPEHELRRRLARAREDRHMNPFIVSDGALTMRPGADRSSTITFHLEVVRADVRGGNQRLVAKLVKYLALNRSGFFRAAYGHERVRAVLIATPTAERAENLRQLASRDLCHGRAMFWFRHYEARPTAGVPETVFTPEAVLTQPWLDVDGTPHSLTAPD